MKTTHFRDGQLIIPADENGKPDYKKTENLGSINKAKKRSCQIGLMKVRKLS